MILVTYCIIFFCLYIGLLYPCLAILGYDVYARKSKTLTTIIRWRRRSKDIWQNRYLNNILKIVAPLIPLSESSEKKMNDDLKRADIPYYAKAILSACLGILVTVFATTLNSALLVIGGLLMSVYLFFKNYDEVKDILKNKNKMLEDEIPTFVRSIESGLHTDRDIIRGFERYKKIASPAMASELDIVIADMQASSVAQGLMRFENRLNSPEISRLCAALIEVDRGIDNSLTLQYLAQDMTVMHRQLILRELDKRPGQMKRAILPAGIVLVIMMFYILIEAVIRSAATLM